MSCQTILLIGFWGSLGLICYAYAIFPLLLAGIARVYRARQPLTPDDVPDEYLPCVAMIVAAHDEGAVLAAKLSNTWRLDYPAERFEILVGSDGSSDGTNSILSSCQDPRLHAFPYEHRRGKISVLNELVQQTDADIIVMSDANTMFAPNAVRKLVRHFSNPKVGCVSGVLSLELEGGVSGEGLYWKYEGWIKYNEGALGVLIGCNGGIYAMRRTLYDAPPPNTIVDDFVLSMNVIKQGFEVRLEPEAKASEPPCPSSRAEMTRKIRIGAGGWQALGLTVSLLHPRFGVCAFAFWGHKVLRWLVPHLYLIMAAANVALARNPWYCGFLAAQALGVVMALLAYFSGSKFTLPRWSRPVSYFYIMNYALGCGFLRYLFKTQRVTWDRGVGACSELLDGKACTIASGRIDR